MGEDAAPGLEAGPRVIGAAELVDAVRVSDPVITSDGATALYQLYRTHEGIERSEIWRCAVAEGKPSRLAIDIEGVNAMIPAPDADRIAIVADGDGSSRLLEVSLSTGVTREITSRAIEMPGSVPGSNPVRDVAWSPDGTTIAFVAYVSAPDADRPAYVEAAPHVRVMRSPGYKEDGIGVMPVGTSQVMVVDVASGAIRRISSTAHDHERPVFSPDGRWIAVRRRGGTDTYHADIVLYSTDEASGPIQVGPEGSLFDWAVWSPDGGRLVVAGRSNEPPSPCRQLFGFDRASVAWTTISADLPAEPLDPAVWLDDSTILVHGFRRATSVVYRMDVRSGEAQIVREMDAGHLGFAVDREARVLVQARETPTTFGEVVAIDLEDGSLRTLADPNRDLMNRGGVAPASRLEVGSDGLLIDVAVLRPTAVAADIRLPTVFAIHGGPADAWGGYFVDIGFLLASNGFQVAMPNLRGSVGFGRAFAEAERGDYGGGEFRDLMAVVDALCATTGTDVERLGIVGGSHGGYLTAWAISQTDRFSAAVCACPVIDLTSEWATSDAGAFWGDLYHGGAPWENPGYYMERSPSTHAHRITTPTLIVHGEDDDRCPVGQAEHLFTILHGTGCPSRLVLYPDASHGFGEPGAPRITRIDYFDRMLAWFERYLRPGEAPAHV